jgi:outer membrane protein insertion porin family
VIVPDVCTRFMRALAGVLVGMLLLTGSGSVSAQPTTPSPGQPPAPPPPGGQPFVPQPGAPPQAFPQQKVAEVVVRGNEHIPPDQILAVVSTKVNDPLNEEKLRNDVQAILGLGYFADAVVRLEPVPGGIRVVFVVVENPVITAVEIKGNTVVSAGDILKTLDVPTGQALNTIAMRRGARAVEKLYQDRGYVLARVSDVSVTPEGVLTITLAEGRIEAIRVEGLYKTKEYVILRELTFKPGDVFNANVVNASLKRLFQLQYFSDVKAQPGPGTVPDTVDVTVQVTEQRTASLSLGVGYSTVGGIQGLIGLRDSDFGGNGQAVTAQYNNTAFNGNNYTLAFHEPYFWGAHTALDILGFNQTTIPTDYSLGLSSSFQYNMYQSGGQVSLTQPLDPVWSLTYGVKSINTNFASPSFGTPPPSGFVFTPGTVNALLLGGIVDTRNDPLFPTDGDRLALTTELAFLAVGGNFQFQKYELDYSHFFPTGPDSTIVAHVHLGTGNISCSAAPGQPCLPLQEQFYLGGPTSLRGFANGRFRGDQEVLLTGEYRFPLSNIGLFKSFSGITAILFVDAGDVAPLGSGPSFSLKPDYGIGFGVKTPIGPFRIDYGISSEGGQLWISTSALF